MAVARSGKVDAARRLLEARRRRQRQGRLGRAVGADVGRRAEPGRDGQVPGVAAAPTSTRAASSASGSARSSPSRVPKDMNKGGFTPLLYAAREGCVECARHLIAAGADPDLEDPERITPLNMALLNLHFEVAAYLIKAGADVDKWDLFGRSPLYMAADVSTLPIKGNGAMAVIPSEDPVTALDVARLLLEAGANPNLQLKRRPPYRDVPQDRGGDTILAQGATPLLRAARAGDAPFVELLLKHKALVDLPSKEGVTPLMAAAGVEFGDARDARTQSHQRRRARDDAAAARRGRRHQRQDGDRAAARRRSTARRSARRRRRRPRRTRQSGAERVGRAAPDRPARRGRARLHAVREIPRRARRRSAGEGRQRPNAARSREGRRRARCSPGRRRAVPGNRGRRTRGAGRRPVASSSSAGGSPRSRRFPTSRPRSSSTTPTRRCRKNGCRRGTPATCCSSGPARAGARWTVVSPAPTVEAEAVVDFAARRAAARRRDLGLAACASSSTAASSRPARGCSPSRSPTRSAPRAGSRCACSTGAAASGCSRATRVTSSCAGTATPSDR